MNSRLLILGVGPAPFAALRDALGPMAACSLRVKPDQPFQRLIPAGQFDAPRGAFAGAGPWVLTAAGAAKIIADNASRSTDILIDFEHQALMAETNGLPVPASGWIHPRALVWREDGPEPGLYGAVTWTAPAREYMNGDQYRYLSPVFPYDPATGEVLGLAHVALTNTPGIDEPIRAALSARRHVSTQGGGSPESQEIPEVNETLKKLLAALGLPETTTEADALAGVAALKTKADQGETEIAALKSATPDPAKYVPVATAEAMKTEIAALRGQLAGGEVEQLISAGLADGRLLDAQRQWAESLGKTNVAALRQYIDTAQPIAALRGTQTQGKNGGEGGDKGQLSAAELAVCRAVGVTAEQFTAQRAA